MNNKKYLIAIDCGTTSCRSVLINKEGSIVDICKSNINQYYPKQGWVEQNPIEIFNTQLSTLQSLISQNNIDINDIDSIGITNQRESIVAWDKHTGLPIYNAIIWQDTRTNQYCESLKNKPIFKTIKNKTGLMINPYFSATKIKWILENVKEAQDKLKTNSLLIGTIDSWLIWKFTNGKSFYTDVSNANRTMLFNAIDLEWDKELLDYFNIPIEILPTIKNSSDDFGFVDANFFDNQTTINVPIYSCIGDQSSSLFGHLCFDYGDTKNTYGTGCFSLCNIGNNFKLSNNKLITTIAWKLKNNQPVYAYEGSVFIAGSAIEWLKDSLRILYDSTEADYYYQLALKNENKYLYVVPSFNGLGAPYWDNTSKGCIFGLDRNTKREHIIKATMDAIAYQTNDLICAIENDINNKISTLKVDGGISCSTNLMKFQASISNLDLIVNNNTEITSLGAAYLAGLYSGFFKDLNSLKELKKDYKVIKPSIKKKIVDQKIKGWKQAVNRTIGWTKIFD